MKRFVGIVVVLALAGLYSACSSSKSTADQDVVIGDIGHDTSADVKDTGKDTVTDTARDTPATEGIVQDTQGVDNPPPPDSGVDTPIATDVPVGTDVPVTTDTNGCIDDSVGSCKAVYACENDCNADTTGDACRQECQAKLSARGLQDYQTFNTCLQQNCSTATTNDEFNACLEAKCLPQYYGCFWGCQYDKCPALVGCLMACPADDPATTTVDEHSVCLGNCWSGGTTAAQVDLQTAIDCTNTACPVCSVTNPTAAQTTECNDCWSTATAGTCSADWDKCTEYGTKKCGEMLTCVNGCTDTTCSQACLSSGTKSAGLLWNAMIDCANTACTASCPANPTAAQTTACNTCFNTALNSGGSCADKTLACQNDAAAQ